MSNVAMAGYRIGPALVYLLSLTGLRQISFQIHPVGVGDCTIGPLWHRKRLLESDAPIQEELKTGAHRMGTDFHDDEAALGNGLQFVRRQQRTLHHLKALAGVIFATAHRTGQDGSASKSFGQGFRSLAVGREATENRVLTVVLDDFAASTAVVFLKLGSGLYDGYRRQAAGTACGEEGQNIKGRHGSQLIAEQHHAVFELATVFISRGKQFPVELGGIL